VSRLFGTDGVRGVANEPPLTPEFALRLGRVAAAYLAERRTDEGAGRRKRPAILVGRDTRLSGPLLEQALVAGILSTGVDVLAGGVLPTPAVAILTRALGACGGIVLSASHNPFADNGIKLFGATGGKLPDAWEDEIEARLAAPDTAPRPHGARLGRLLPAARAERRYLEALRATVPTDLELGGMRLVVDCANGATCRVAPRLFRGLGAEVTTLGVRPTGRNINAGVGALHPEGLQARVRQAPGAIGIAFDGDGDRLITVDEQGEVRDGDHLLGIFATALAGERQLRGGVVIGTVMANLGLERMLAGLGLGLVRTAVGDRYVLEEMVRRDANLGGEQSGHIIFLDHAPTGDGVLSALQLLRIVRATGRPLTALAAGVTKYPQVLVNVPIRSKPPLDTLPTVSQTVERWERKLEGRGRILLRYSGTEPLARVMVEGDDQMTIETVAQEIAAVVRTAIGSPS
jgi:phosphoglucosamine mutase